MQDQLLNHKIEFIPTSKLTHLISILSFYTTASQGHPRTVKFNFSPLCEFWKAYISHKYLIYFYGQCPLPTSSNKPLWENVKPQFGNDMENNPWQLGFHFRWATRIFPYFPLLFPQSSCSNIFFLKGQQHNAVPQTDKIKYIPSISNHDSHLLNFETFRGLT